MQVIQEALQRLVLGGRLGLIGKLAHLAGLLGPCWALLEHAEQALRWIAPVGGLAGLTSLLLAAQLSNPIQRGGTVRL